MFYGQGTRRHSSSPGAASSDIGLLHRPNQRGPTAASLVATHPEEERAIALRSDRFLRDCTERSIATFLATVPSSA